MRCETPPDNISCSAPPALYAKCINHNILPKRYTPLQRYWLMPITPCSVRSVSPRVTKLALRLVTESPESEVVRVQTTCNSPSAPALIRLFCKTDDAEFYPPQSGLWRMTQTSRFPCTNSIHVVKNSPMANSAISTFIHNSNATTPCYSDTAFRGGGRMPPHVSPP